ncbi:HlyC/CorC family transporter [Alkalisalibacterium limincola]|uniref:Magnesium and cobalt efflux protein CorC n=1 Tax=Alkalisalibacterium limincola TaxID=2699169 RepID=A0A5C8KNM3_9GAMM|nr:transporter associated domain-containing protein [Alkalisalibacterium limincola]TXK62577.1 CBS domain-containing protein [Alkalisalibacterium limincola]
MSEEPGSTTAPEKRSWLDRISQVFSGEPRNREDLLEGLREAQARGLLSIDTLAMIEGAIAVSEQQVGDVMIPRAQMVALSIDLGMDEVLAIVIDSGHSRFPVYGEERDEILGILLAKDLLKSFAEDAPPQTLAEFIRPAVMIPESKRLNVLLKEFRLSRNHMAIVVDEYGGVAGLVTIEDVLEQIVGEIDDEHDEDEDDGQTQIAAQADGRYVVDALTPIEDFNERFGADFPDDEYDTIGGLVITAIGHLPQPGEELALGRFSFRVASVDDRRVESFMVSLNPDV